MGFGFIKRVDTYAMQHMHLESNYYYSNNKVVQDTSIHLFGKPQVSHHGGALDSEETNRLSEPPAIAR